MKLYEPIKINNLTLSNRIVLAPMASCMADPHTNAMNDDHLIHYGSIAQGGPGLIIVEATAVEPRGRITIHDLGLWNEDQMKTHRKLNDWIHRRTPAKTGIQLAHSGRKGVVTSFMTPVADHRGVDREFGALSVSSSNKPYNTEYTPPHPLTLGECEEVKKYFVDAAEFAVEAGYDAIEIHAAHGILLNQFSSPLVNDRTDKYGGSREARFAYPLEVFVAVRSAIPSTMPLIVRISATDWHEGGITVEDSIEYSKAMKAIGVDVVHVSSGAVVLEQSIEENFFNYQVPFSNQIRKGAQISTIAVGKITDAAEANRILENGEADLIAIGRGFLRNPYWAKSEAEKYGIEQWSPKYQSPAYPKSLENLDWGWHNLSKVSMREVHALLDFSKLWDEIGR